MAAAYAGLVSLMNTMDQIQIHPHLSTSFDNYQFESLLEMLHFLLDFVENDLDFFIREKKVYFLEDSVENYPDAGSTEAEDLVRRIAVSAHDAENIIEVEAADRIRAASTKKTSGFLPDLEKIIQELDFIKEKVIKLKEGTGFITLPPTYSSMPSTPLSSSAPPATAKTTIMVGFDDYMMQLLDQLTGYHSNRRIIPIVGMGGIGKTTLARNVYEHPLILNHFDVRAWITVSQQFSVRDIFLQALSCSGRSTSNTDASVDQLGDELYIILSGRRYLIVLDDVWSVEAWEKIKFFIPENNNGSRIVVTTRQSYLADYFGSSAVAVGFLDEINSWALFCEKTFQREDCHPELEKIGKKIVNKCKGLPLAITVIGGLLAKSFRTIEYWENIAKHKSLLLDSGEVSEIWSILYLSYKHLPVWLKSCFLYLGIFPEDCEINVSRLIKLWVAEGFIRSNTEQSLEEVAESCTKELVDRNLLLVGRLGPDKKLESCRVHDIVRELCIRVAEKENFFLVQRGKNESRHYLVDQTTARAYRGDSHTREKPSLVSPLIFHGQRQGPFKSRLLRVLVRDEDHLDSSLQQLNLRLLSHRFYWRDIPSLPSSISLLWSLQTLIITGSTSTIVAPPEIWKMPQLRHIDIWSVHLPDPPSGKHDEVFALKNLQTLKHVQSLILSDEVCKRIPNIKELGIHYNLDEPGEASSYNLHNVGCLNKLESLYYYNDQGDYLGGSLQNLKFPSSLKKLVLVKCSFAWSDMRMIGWLPHLEYLELGRDAVAGPEWISDEGEFLSLKYLIIDSCDLMNWTADASSFPVLESLFLRFLSKLSEIPPDIGECPALETITIHCCSQSACISAIKILEEQESLGNDNLHLQVICGSETEAQKLREFEELTFQNLLITFTPGSSLAPAGKYNLDFDSEDYPNPAIVQYPESRSEKQSRRFSEIYEVKEESHSYLEGKPGSEILREESSDLLDAHIDSLSISEYQSEQQFGDEIAAEGLTLTQEEIEILREEYSDMLDADIDSLSIVGDEIKAEGLTLTQEDSKTETEMFKHMPMALSSSASQKRLEPECQDEIQAVDELTTETDAEKFSGEQRGTEGSKHHEEGISFQEKNPYLVTVEDNHLQLKLDNLQTILIADNPDISLANAMLNLADQDLRELHGNPNYPNSLLLFLQRNRRLSLIHPSFFDSMPDLQFLDLSDTKIRILPSSLFKLSKLKVLLLRNCMCLDSLPREIGRLNQLEALDLSGAELYDLPDEIGQLGLLSSMQLSFYGPDDESEYDHLPSRLLSPTFLSELKEVQALSITVHPEDHRWAEIVVCIINDVSKLEGLSYLQFYFPQVEMFETFIQTSPSWEKQKVSRFDFIVGQNVKRIASRVPDEVDSLFNQHEGCLRYVNGDGAVSPLFKSVLARVSAFYLDHHTEVQSLSEFDVSNFKALKFCVVRECPRIQTIFDEKNVVGAFPCLEQLQIYFLWELKQIWQPPSLGRLKRIFRTPRPYDNFKALRCLIINTCPKLQFILWESMLQCLTSLEELVVEDCERVEKIIKEEKKKVKYEDSVLPRLRKLVLHYLPELVSVGNGVCLSEEKINVYGCPKFDLQLSISNSLPMKSLVEE